MSDDTGAWPPPRPDLAAYPPPPVPPYGVPAGGPTLPAFPHAEPTPYHRMLRTWTYEPWKPVVGVLLLLVGFFLVAPLAALPVLFVSAGIKGGDFLTNVENSLSLKHVDAGVLLYLNLSIACLIPISWGIMRALHRMRPRWLTSVKPRMRWSFFFACLGISVVALVAQVAVSSVIPDVGGTGFGGHLNHFTAGSAAAAIVVMLTTPLQAAGEEYAFRGYLMQAVGSLTGSKWVAILVTSFLFALAHGAQNAPLFFDRLAFGLIASWLVTRTGGLEAGIALHILNNVLAFAAALLYGDLTSTLTVRDVSWWNIVVTLTQSIVFTVLVVVVAKRMRLRNTTDPAGAAAVPAPV